VLAKLKEHGVSLHMIDVGDDAIGNGVSSWYSEFCPRAPRRSATASAAGGAVKADLLDVKAVVRGWTASIRPAGFWRIFTTSWQWHRPRLGRAGGNSQAGWRLPAAVICPA